MTRAIAPARPRRAAVAGLCAAALAGAGLAVLPAAPAAAVDSAIIYATGSTTDVLGYAEVSPANWIAGDIVTISVFVAETPRSYDVVIESDFGDYTETYYYGATDVVIQGSEFWEPWTVSPAGGGNYGAGWSWRAYRDPAYDDKLPSATYTFQAVAKLDRTATPNAPVGGITVTRPQEWGAPSVKTVSGAFSWGAPIPHDPVASFDWAADPADDHAIAFTNTSTDQEDAASALRASWDFGDGTTSTEWSPSHRYDSPDRYTVTLTVTDTSGRTDTVTQEVRIGRPLVVNSTGDDPAADAAAGCDTGGMVGDPGEEVPECTLRAAIEAAVADGGAGKISFAIPGSPVIALGSALPPVTGTMAIDGTTQSGGWVEVSGGGAATLSLGTGAATVIGLALHGATFALELTGGSGHLVEGNRLGLDLAGAWTDDTAAGLVVTGGEGGIVRGNVVAAAEAGVLVTGGALATIEGNAIGATAAGAPLGAGEIGVLLADGPAAIAGNLVRGTEVGVVVAGAAAGGTSITGNRVGTTGTSAADAITGAFGDAGTGIVVEGVPDAAIDGNIVAAGGWGGILVAGSVQISQDDDGLHFHSPTDPEIDTPVTGTDIAVMGNTVAASASGSRGLGTWAEASGVAFSGNAVLAAGSTGLLVEGGAGHSITGNALGSPATPLAFGGIAVDDAVAPTIADNTVLAAGTGIYLSGDGEGATIAGNAVMGTSASGSAGILVTGERPGVAVQGNTIADEGRAGIEVDGPGAVVAENVVTGSGDGIRVDGAGVVVRGNTVGATADLGSVPGSIGNGIAVFSGDASLRDNVVVGSGAAGVLVDDAATATLRANRIWDSVGLAIDAPDAAPLLSAALIADTESTTRTTLIVTGIPADAAGTIEVFANDTCAADGGQARYITGITRPTKPGRSSQVIQFESARDHFTLTYTDTVGATSRLSVCVDRAIHPDSDGDGSPDPLDGIVNAAANPSLGVIVTPGEQLLTVAVSNDALFDGGRLEALRIVDDPAPGSHPAGWSLPYGAISFRVAGLEPGGRTAVVLATVYQDEALEGTSYWKYGATTPGAAPGWYDFAPDAESGTGAQRVSRDVPGLGYRVTYQLLLVDGGRGDADGAMNGTVTDPGGPVVGAPDTTGPVVPVPPRPAALGTTGSTSGSGSGGGAVWIALLVAGAGFVLIRLGRRRAVAR